MPSVTVENYLKQICLEELRQPPNRSGRTPRRLVAMGRLAEAVGVTPGTATTMAKSLADAKLVRYTPRDGVALTPAGRRLAHATLRRHRLIEQFLVEVLHMDWAEVHDEAEELEHTISDKVLEKIDALLGHPATDPHGSPIPRNDAPLATDHLPTLNTCPTDREQLVARVIDHDPEFLRFAEAHGLVPGNRVTVRERMPHAEAVRLDTKTHHGVTLGTRAADKILVDSVPR